MATRTVAFAWACDGMNGWPMELFGIYETDDLAKQACMKDKQVKQAESPELPIFDELWEEESFPLFFRYWTHGPNGLNYLVDIYEVKDEVD